MAETRNSGWTSYIIFAGVMMLLIGSFTMIQGLVALLSPTYYAVGEEGLLIFDFTTWGWLMLGVGLLVTATGVGLLAGQTWARVTGIVLAAINAIGQIAFLASFPVWSILVIALDVLAIYAIAAHGREFAEMSAREEEREKRMRAA